MPTSEQFHNGEANVGEYAHVYDSLVGKSPSLLFVRLLTLYRSKQASRGLGPVVAFMDSHVKG